MHQILSSFIPRKKDMKKHFLKWGRKSFFFLSFIEDWICLHFEQLCTTFFCGLNKQHYTIFVILTREIQKEKTAAHGSGALVVFKLRSFIFQCKSTIVL